MESAYQGEWRGFGLRRSPFFGSQQLVLCTFFFFLSLSLFRHLSSRSRSRWHLTKESEERGCGAMRAGGKTRGEIYYGARRAVAGSYFKIRRARTSRPWCVLARVRAQGTYGDDLRWTDGRRYGRQMYYVRLNSMRGRPRSAARNETEKSAARLRNNYSQRK